MSDEEINLECLKMAERVCPADPDKMIEFAKKLAVFCAPYGCYAALASGERSKETGQPLQ